MKFTTDMMYKKHACRLLSKQGNLMRSSVIISLSLRGRERVTNPVYLVHYIANINVLHIGLKFDNAGDPKKQHRDENFLT